MGAFDSKINSSDGNPEADNILSIFKRRCQ